MKYLKAYESHDSFGTINWLMIEDIKDMSLEYLDDGFILGIYVYSSKFGAIYRLTYCHNDGVNGHWRLKDKNNHWDNSDKLGHIFYSILLYNISDAKHYPKESKELISRIEEAYPDEDIRG